MFRCQLTKRQTQPGEPCFRVVVARRIKHYTKKVRNEETDKLETVEAATGWEIVREVNACEEGKKQWESEHPDGAPFVQSIVNH